jgi:hypothetical protein
MELNFITNGEFEREILLKSILEMSENDFNLTHTNRFTDIRVWTSSDFVCGKFFFYGPTGVSTVA